MCPLENGGDQPVIWPDERTTRLHATVLRNAAPLGVLARPAVPMRATGHTRAFGVNRQAQHQLLHFGGLSPSSRRRFMSALATLPLRSSKIAILSYSALRCLQ
jgi:hypothetical protein